MNDHDNIQWLFSHIRSMILQEPMPVAYCYISQLAKLKNAWHPYIKKLRVRYRNSGICEIHAALFNELYLTSNMLKATLAAKPIKQFFFNVL